MKKYYCFVDESGLETIDSQFIVGILLFSGDRDQYEQYLLEIEETSKKRHKKWKKAKDEYRTVYIKSILSSAKIKQLYVCAIKTHAYKRVTAEIVAQVFSSAVNVPYKVTVIIDGLKKNERSFFSRTLRDLGISTEKVRGADEESDCYIRLVDAICGFVSDVKKGRVDYQPIYKKALTSKKIIEVRYQKKYPHG